jgi:hypothetical protein
MIHEAMEGILFLMAYIVVKREVVSRNALWRLSFWPRLSCGLRRPGQPGTRALGRHENFGKSAA